MGFFLLGFSVYSASLAATIHGELCCRIDDNKHVKFRRPIQIVHRKVAVNIMKLIMNRCYRILNYTSSQKQKSSSGFGFPWHVRVTFQRGCPLARSSQSETHGCGVLLPRWSHQRSLGSTILNRPLVYLYPNLQK